MVSSSTVGADLPQPWCLSGMLAEQAHRTPDALAILAPGRSPLTYGHLRLHVHEMVQRLHALGVGRHDRVAVVLPNGPEMAVACLAVAAGAVCVPLNPEYGVNDFDVALRDVYVNTLIVQEGVASPARAIALALGKRIVELSPRLNAAAGLFTLSGHTPPQDAPQECAKPDDVALMLYTTGTTAQPKGVPLTHANVCVSAHNMRRALALSTRDRCLNVMPLFHAHGLMGALLASLAAGASVVCTSGFVAPTFFAWLADYCPTWYTAVPTIHQAIMARAPAHHDTIARCSLRFIRSGSATLSSQVLAQLETIFQAPVIEYYGMTEAASQITCNPLPPRVRKPGSVGVAAGPEVAVIDEHGTFVPAGTSGEIVIRGPNVMSGYDHEAPAHHNVFRPGWFRTGDLGFLDTDGYLFLTGRLKEIINRGGEKIAPQEVEAALMLHPAVVQAVAFAAPDARLGEEIAAAVVLHSDSAATAHDLRQFASARLAAWKVPRHVCIVETIPRGPGGKLQRWRLAEQLGLTATIHAQPPALADFTPPRTQLEKILVDLWTQVLAVEQVGIHDDFFALGGDSILATQLIVRLREATHVEVSPLSFFEVPTVAAMARSIEASDRTAMSWPVLPLQPVPQQGALPLSYSQQRLWFLEQMGLVRHAYTIMDAMRLCGPLQLSALTQSLQEIFNRHAILRTTFIAIEGQPRQVIGPVAALPLSVVDLRAFPAGAGETQMRACAQAEAQRSFDLTRGPLLHLTLVRLAEEESVLLLSMHHIVSDGWSQGVLWRELAVLYTAFAAGEPSPLPALPVQYADFAVWQQQGLQGDVLRPALAYWKQQLAAVTTLQIPTDYPRPAVKTFRGARHAVTWSAPLTQALKELSQQHGVTLFMTLLAAFQTLLHRYTGQDDVVVGSLSANRSQVATEALIGFFVNTVVLRTDFSGDPPFEELLTRVREVTLGAYSHRELPFEKLLEELRPPRDLSQTPLFQVLFVLQNTPRAIPALAPLHMRPIDVDPETARFDLTLDLTETSTGLHGWFEYSTDLFEAATITRMAEHLQTLLEGIVADPMQRLSQLPLLRADERQQLLMQWNTTHMDYPHDQCLYEAFEAQVRRTPEAPAVVSADGYLSYRELNHRANQVAHALQALGVGAETLVGLCVERSLVMVVGLLGILKAGAACVPMDPTSPAERLAFMLQDAQMPVVLSQAHLRASLQDSGATIVCLDSEWHTMARHSNDNPSRGATADQVAYLLYTSGSTGHPKGVLGVHRATMNALAWMWQAHPFTSDDVCCQKTSISFGDSIQELLGPLLQGVRTILIPDTVVKDLPRFVQTLAAHGVTRLILVPSLLRALLDIYDDLQERLPRLRLWFAGGEVLSSDLWQRFQARLPQSRLINLYGAAEMSDDVTAYAAGVLRRPAASVPIGRPIANMQTYVLDRHLQPVPIGVPGELYVGGAGLTRGYLNRPTLTAEHFIQHPFSAVPGARLYKTGDLVRYLPDGNLEFLGRLDHQVKLRGIRIELGEIETVLSQHPALREVVVTLYGEAAEEQRLVAYMVPAHTQVPPVPELRNFLKKTLPDALIPTTFVWLTALPRTPSGKPDRQALPSPDRSRPVLDVPFVAPHTPSEQQIAAIWSDLLGVERIGSHDNFFELGGHSLLVTQCLSRLSRALSVDVPLVSFFANPTVAGLASHVESASTAPQRRSGLTVVPIPREHALPASMSQERLWAVEQVLPGVPFFNTTYAVGLVGRLQTEILEQSFNAIIQRHEILRTTFATVNGQPVQVIAPHARVALAMTDLRTVPASTREEAAQRLAAAEVRRPFDLAQGPLLRVCLLRLDEQEHRLLVTMHHIISDGWSLGILVQELGTLYDAFAAGEAPSLPALLIQYADFASWQRQWRHNTVMETQLAYWQQQLRPPLPVLELPTDFPRGKEISFHTARQHLVFPKTLCDALTQLSSREHSTLFTILVAAFKVLLYAYTGQQDLRVATFVANRQRWETEALIGLVANTVILRTDLSGNPTYQEVLHKVQATARAAYAHQDLPFEEIVQTLERERGLQRQSLCQVMFIFQNAMLRPVQHAARTLRFLEVDQGPVMPDLALTALDIILVMRERPQEQGLAGTCVYKTALFEAATIHRLLADYQDVLERFIVQPEQPLLALRATRRARGRDT